MTRAAAVALGIVAWVAGCAPRGAAPPEVQALRRQLRRKTLAIPTWSREVADELAARGGDYAGRTLAVHSALLDPRGDLRIGRDACRFHLAGGGSAVVPTAAVPAWLRSWTGAPVKLRGVVDPPRSGEDGLLLRCESVDFAHPLELAWVEVERGPDGAWLAARVENYRGEGARATVEVRFDTFRERRRLPAVPPGEAANVRVKLFGATEPNWAALPPEQRRLSLLFDDGTAVHVDIGKWLEGPPESVLDLAYTFAPPANGVLALSSNAAEGELERLAALELRAYLAEFTDANLEPREPSTSLGPGPDAEGALPALPLLVVGTARHNALAAELVRTAGLEGRVAELGEEGYLLKSLRHGERPTVLVTAAAPRGVVNGAYALLERWGVQYSMFGVRLPARAPFRLPEVDEAKKPLFARRTLVASGDGPTAVARWTQWQWLAMIDLAAKNRFNEAVFPLDGLEATFGCEPGRGREAVFPFETTPPHSCVAQAALAHRRGLAILADYARRRGMTLGFARRVGDRLCRAAPPACLGATGAAEGLGQAIDVLDDAGDLLALPRVEETAGLAGALLAAKATAFAAPYRSGSRARVSFLARFAWDAGLTPEANFRRWAGTLCEGAAADKLARAMLEIDRLDGEALAAAPPPFGQGGPLAFPVEEGDLACDWAALRARATGAAAAAQVKGLKDQAQKLRGLQTRIEPIHAAFREALGTVPPPWEAPLFESASAARRGERAAEGIQMLRALLGALAGVQEGALAYNAALAEPAEALPRLAAAADEWRQARRTLLWLRSRSPRGDTGPAVARLAERLGEQAALLAEWLGPAAEADPGPRLTLAGSDAVVVRFRTRTEDVFAAYKLAGEETVQLRLNAREARLFRRGQAPRTLRGEGGVFLVALSAVPTYLVARRAAAP